MNDQKIFPPTVAKIFLAVVLFAMIIVGGGCSIEEQSVISLPSSDKSECEINSDCELVYVGSDACPPCDTLSEEYQCLNESEKIKIWEEQIERDKFKPITACSSCAVEFDKYVCKCANGKCEKIKEESIKEVIITTDKMEYGQGEDIKIKITSNKNKSIFPDSHESYLISKFEKGEWNVINQDCQCEFMCNDDELINCPRIIFMGMPSNYFFEFKSPYFDSWKQTECVSEKQMCGDKLYTSVFEKEVSAGKYQISFCYWNEEDINIEREIKYAPQNKKKCVKSQFTIKEKSALDPRCGEKVTGEGNCPGAWLGYEFDQNEGICIKKGVSGCSYKTPFKTFEECQEVCEKTGLKDKESCEAAGGKWEINDGEVCNLPIINPITGTQCKIDADCWLVYVDDYVCLPWDTSLEKYKCLNSDEAKIFGGEKIDPNVMCSIPAVEFDKYVCKCANGKCEKVKEESIKEVIITTDKMEYGQGEMVEIAVKSNVDKEMMICSPFYIIERFNNEEWIKVKRVACPCEGNIMCRIATYFILQSDDLKEFSWDQIESWCSGPIRNSKTISNQVPVGKYRVKSLVSDTKDCGINSKNIYSNEFTIKEKSAPDARCGEKVEGIGSCKRSAIGYEFDSNLEKCVEKRVGGCSFEIPFGTLEECQEVCEKQLDTSDWQTYRNEEFGFEIDYKSFNSKVCRKPSTNDDEPTFCLIDENNEIIPYSDFRISVLQNPEELSAKEFVEDRKEIALSLNQPWHSGSNMTEQEIQVNNYDAYLYNNVFGGDCGEKKYYIVYKNKAVVISFTGATPNYDNMKYNLGIFDQMLSSFKFTD